jgi:hypothetical protein
MKYLLQIWHPYKEVWINHDHSNNLDAARRWQRQSPDDRRVLDFDTRAIIVQPED